MKKIHFIAVVFLLIMASCHSVPEVEASTECPDCGGTGYTDTIACTDCGASGEVECTLCDGSGRTDPPCTICGGGRQIPCSYCGESGVNADGTPCPNCEGMGFVDCPSCYGIHDKCECVYSGLHKAGRLPCPTCDGLGEVHIECKTCNGSGRL